MEGNAKKEDNSENRHAHRGEIRKVIKKDKYNNLNKMSEPYIYSKQIRDLFKANKYKELVLLT